MPLVQDLVDLKVIKSDSEGERPQEAPQSITMGTWPGSCWLKKMQLACKMVSGNRMYSIEYIFTFQHWPDLEEHKIIPNNDIFVQAF
eukprot:2271501-Ditylum_brightwellii.AAC.1